MRLGGNARVGLEDNIYLDKGVLSAGSAPLVERAAAYARSIGREPVDPARARKALGLVAAPVSADGAPSDMRSRANER
jgi:3-keto-5-aminohexanoate cleavage enzyme